VLLTEEGDEITLREGNFVTSTEIKKGALVMA
jgi:hypothetical protein